MSGWKKAKLGDCCVENGIQTGPFGSQLHQSDYSEAGTPVIMPKDIRDGRVVEDGIARVGEVHVKRLSRHRVAKNNIVYPRRGDVGKAAFITGKEVGWLCGTGCLKVDLNEDVVDPVFIRYFLALNDSVSWLEKHAVGSTMLNINAGILAELPIALPPLPTQRRIAAMLSDYDSAIDNARRQIALLEEAAMRLYREWFVVNADPKWEKRQLWDVCDYFRGVSYTSKEIEGKDGVPLITLKNIERFGGFREDRSKTFSGVCKDGSSAGANDVLMAVTDMTKERRLVGHVAMVPDTYDKAQFSMDLIRLKGKLVSDSFLYAMLRYSTYADEFAVRASGANVLHLKPSSLDDCEVVVPKRVLCEKFDSTFVPMVQKKNALYRAILRSTEARNRLLPKLMSGEVEV